MSNSEKCSCCLETRGKAVVWGMTMIWRKAGADEFSQAVLRQTSDSETPKRDVHKCLAYLPFCSIRRLSYDDCIPIIWNLDLEEK